MYEDRTGRRNAEGYPDPTAHRASNRVACRRCSRWRHAAGRPSGVCAAKVSRLLSDERGPMDACDIAAMASAAVTAPGDSCGGFAGGR